MIILPEDVCNYILSFLPVKDPKYDQCINQLMYLCKDHKRWRGEFLSHPWNRSLTHRYLPKNNLISLRRYILDKNRNKMPRAKKKWLKYKKIYNPYYIKKMKDHRQKLRLQLINQQKNTVEGDSWTMKNGGLNL